MGKARTALLFQKPTRVLEDAVTGGRSPMLSVPDFTPVRGGIPLVVRGQVVGAVGVSGSSSADRDEQLALAGAGVLAPEPAAASAAASGRVTLFRSDRVQAAFAAGRPLLESESFKILASRRDGPGKVEIHALDTDVAFIQQGSATLVTGGSVHDAKTIEPNEIRAESSSGGQTQQVEAGDVVVIPKGVPHWFASVTAPFTYYVVKVR
jgi:mannose-6-phosphate isomerase-like protein (cupin superfamily)